MKLFLKLTFKQLFHFLKNPRQRRFIYIAFKYGNKQRFKNIKVKFNGFKMTIVDSLSFIWQYKDIFKDEIYLFDNNNNKELIIYDCGANVGTSCLFFKKHFPLSKITAFEADPHIANILKENMYINNLSGIEIINKAVWIDNKGIELYPDGADGASVYGKGNKIKIDSIRLKDLLKEEEQIDMLKMDIEGAEADVITDCQDSLTNVKNFFIEYHSFIDQKQRLSDILSILTKNKFRYYIQPLENRIHPFINKKNKSNSPMDIQLNIFAYK
ncbi:MAG: hypothetical protein AUJ97_08130 [Bacteroidetes bacterium CG2_30_32_10]|nr:MAG: hypothetical protein AUJ97_08130 [Bacteroidetes bacterium CG2_30_32_10]